MNVRTILEYSFNASFFLSNLIYMFDWIIIGAGYGGIAAASLLQKRGFKTCILEAHSLIGGCASNFKRKDFLFDVGATTFSAVNPNQPVGKLFGEMEIFPNLIHLDPGMIIRLEDKEIIRHSNFEKWIEEANRHFPEKNLNLFWNKIKHLDHLAWEFIDQNTNLPPRTLSDLISLIRFQNINKIPLVRELFRSVQDELKSLKIENKNLIRFLDEQLLITTQNTSPFSPLLTSAMGLAYPSETYYPMGGMYKPAELLIKRFSDLNGEIFLNEKVISISRLKNEYKLETKKGNIFYAKGIISNLTTLDMARLTSQDLQKYFLKQSKHFTKASGAFSLYFAVESNKNLDSLYYQIHFKNKIPYIDANAFFVSFSHLDDREKAPIGFRTVTISTHTNPIEWIGLSRDSYKEKKSLVSSAILSEFDLAFPEMKHKLFPLAGTPKTFAYYTGREKGFVGGIPHSIQNNLFKITPNVTPFQNLFLVGDTVFPGQGIPAVVLGALNIVERITKISRS